MSVYFGNNGNVQPDPSRRWDSEALCELRSNSIESDRMSNILKKRKSSYENPPRKKVLGWSEREIEILTDVIRDSRISVNPYVRNESGEFLKLLEEYNNRAINEGFQEREYGTIHARYQTLVRNSYENSTESKSAPEDIPLKSVVAVWKEYSEKFPREFPRYKPFWSRVQKMKDPAYKPPVDIFKEKQNARIQKLLIAAQIIKPRGLPPSRSIESSLNESEELAINNKQLTEIVSFAEDPHAGSPIQQATEGNFEDEFDFLLSLLEEEVKSRSSQGCEKPTSSTITPVFSSSTFEDPASDPDAWMDVFFKE